MLSLTEAAEFRLEQTLEWMEELDAIAQHCGLKTWYELGLHRKLNYLRTYGLFKSKDNGVRYVDAQDEDTVCLTPECCGRLNHNFALSWRRHGERTPYMHGLLYWNGPSRTDPADLLNNKTPDFDIKKKGLTWEWSVHT